MEGAAFCTRCGVRFASRGSRAKGIAIWGGIGCAGLLVLFVVVVIVAALATGTSSMPEKEKTVVGQQLQSPSSALHEQEASSRSEPRQAPISDPSAWYGAGERCDNSEMARWSDETWQDTAVRYLGATILLGISGTQWSLSPRDLREYRDFLNGAYRPSTGEWSSVLDTHREFGSTLMSGTMVARSGSTLLIDSFRPDFPRAWLATYHNLLPALVEMSLPDGRLSGAISIAQGVDDNPVHGSLDLFRNQFDCRTAELQE